MLVLQSILIYGLIIWIMTYNAARVLRRKFLPVNFRQFITDKNIIFPILVFCFFAAIRWQVGVDCNGYIMGFYDRTEIASYIKKEWAFVYLQEFIRLISDSHIPFFFLLAFLQIFFVYYSFKDKPWILVFFASMLFLCGAYWTWMNAVRQSIVCSIFIYVVSLLSKKKWLTSILWVIIASFFHRSALILLPILVLFSYQKIIISNQALQLCIVIACYLLMGLNVTKSFTEIVDNALNIIGYDVGSQIHLIETIMEKSFGLRSFLVLSANMIIILFVNKMKSYYNSPHFNIMYNLYYFGVCSSLIFYGNHGIERFLMYFTCFTPIIMSSCAYYLYTHKNKLTNLLALIMLLIILSVRIFYDFYIASGLEVEYTLYKSILFNNAY